MKLRASNLLFVLALTFCFACNQKSEPTLLLPVYGEKRIGNNDTIYHTIGAFELTNQNAEKVNAFTTKGKIYVADFFFASCQSICPQMSSNLTTVQKAFEKEEDVLILSHSVNPLHDTVEVLKKYAESYGAISGKWHLLTGSKTTIYNLAKNDYLVNALEDDGTPEGFLHSELFLLIDKFGRIRGMYDGTDKVQVNKLIEDIKLLKTEKESTEIIK